MWLNPLARPVSPPPPGVTDGGVSMSTGGCFPGGTVSEADRETGETLCRTAAGIPPAVQVSLAFIPHKPSSPSHMPSHPLTPPHRGHPDACISQQAVLQLACAVVEALTGDRSRHWEEMASIEKVCLPRERSTLHLIGTDVHSLSFTCTHSC